MGIKQNKCEVRGHNFEINFSQSNATPEFPDPVTYFEDHTLNHYKALINVRVSFAPVLVPPGTITILQVVIQPRNNLEEINVDIPLFFQVGENIEGQVVVQIEDADSVSIRFENRLNGELIDAGSPITGTINVQKDFCICCP